jgi:translocation and assembly module TamA
VISREELLLAGGGPLVVRALATVAFALAAALPAYAQEGEGTSEPATVATTHRAGPRTPRTGPVSIEWKVPEPMRKLLADSLPAPDIEPDELRRLELRPFIRDVRRRVPEIAAAEGYFSAKVEVAYADDERGHLVITVDLGQRTTVESIDVEFRGDIAGEGLEREKHRTRIRDSWTLQAGSPMRSADWDAAKSRLAEELVDTDYAAGELVQSEALVDAESATAKLKVVLDSGPPFTFGDFEIVGTENYTEAVVRRLVDLKPGERYSVERLTMLQRRIQEGPWFSSVVIDVPHDPAKHERVPVKITVTERPRQEVGLALGYGTDEGARAEVSYRLRDLFDRGLDLQSSMRVSQERSFAYADVYLPPGLMETRRWGVVPFRDSVGVLVERSDSQNLLLRRFAVAGYRHFKLEKFETRLGLSYQFERATPDGAEEQLKRALAPIVAVTWRHVDNPFDPRRGGVLNVQLAAGSKELASGDDFIKTYLQYQYWIPLGASDQLMLRTEAGRTFTDSRERIPEDFLFRAGGSRSNRGYAYQALGVQEGNAIVGGRVLATASVDYVHWLDQTWGAALFADAGDAKDIVSDIKPNWSYGIGARLRTPAGPMAIDLAYAQEPRKWRLSFSVTVAF